MYIIYTYYIYTYIYVYLIIYIYLFIYIRIYTHVTYIYITSRARASRAMEVSKGGEGYKDTGEPIGPTPAHLDVRAVDCVSSWNSFFLTCLFCRHPCLMMPVSLDLDTVSCCFLLAWTSFHPDVSFARVPHLIVWNAFAFDPRHLRQSRLPVLGSVQVMYHNTAHYKLDAFTPVILVVWYLNSTSPLVRLSDALLLARLPSTAVSPLFSACGISVWAS